MSVCVVGHGTSPKNRRWGADIDTCDTVIRMFDCNWQSDGDYGSKYDFGVVTAGRAQIGWFGVEAVRRPREWWVYRQDGALITLDADEPVSEFTASTDRQFALQLGAKTLGGRFALTRGAATACHAIRSLRPKQLILVGFDEVRAGTYSRDPYSPECLGAYSRRSELASIVRDLSGRALGPLSSGHDLSVEMRTIQNAANECGVTVKHADEVWP